MRKLAFATAVLLIVSSGCVISPRRTVNSIGGGGGGSNSEFSLSANPTTQVITAGATASYTITVQAVNGFTGTVSLSSSSANSNIVTAFDNTTITGGSGTAVLTAVTNSSTPSGTVTITVTAADTTGGVSQNVTVTATVQGGAATAGAMISQAAMLPTQGCVNPSASSIAQRVSFPATPATSGFTATFAATPSSASIDASLGFFAPASGGQAALLPQQLSSLINFSPAGVIQARDGDSFAASTIPYSAGETFQFRLVENLPAATYSVFVTPPGAPEIPLGTNLQVPSDQRGITTLTGWGMMVSAPESATMSVCSFALR